MKTIHKYVLSDVRNDITTHSGARVLHVAGQHNQICVWAEVDTSADEVTRRLYVVGTGHEIPADAGEYLGSVLVDDGRFVFHVYAEPLDDDNPEARPAVAELGSGCAA